MIAITEAGYAADGLIAEHILGWTSVMWLNKLIADEGLSGWPPEWNFPAKVPRFTTELKPAIALLEHVCGDDYDPIIRRTKRSEGTGWELWWRVEITGRDPLEAASMFVAGVSEVGTFVTFAGQAESLPLAACRALAGLDRRMHLEKQMREIEKERAKEESMRTSAAEERIVLRAPFGMDRGTWTDAGRWEGT